MKYLITRLARFFKDIPSGVHRGSNRASLWVRTRLEPLPIRQIVGVQLAGLAFFSAVIVPQAGELASALEVQMETAVTEITAIPSTESTFRWPLVRFGLTSRFSLGHPGIDLTAPKGTDIYPVAEGWVSWVNVSGVGYGKHVLVEHDNGVKSLYAHLSAISVAVGDTIEKESKLGEVGATGWATGNHLHLEMYQDNTPINPLEVLPAIQ